MVEQSAVNRSVVGSSPTSGANFKSLIINESPQGKVLKSPQCQKKCQKIWRNFTTFSQFFHCSITAWPEHPNGVSRISGMLECL